MTQDKDVLRRDRAALVKALTDAGAVFVKENVIKCCFHDDQTPSASLYAKDGVWRFKCHGCGFCGDIFDVREKASGKSVEDQLMEFSDNDRDRAAKETIYPTLAALQAGVVRDTGGTLEQTFQNTNPITGHADMVVLRLRMPDGKKTIRQARPQGGGFARKAPAHPWPLYGRNRVAKLTPESILVVEGENKVHAAADAGIVAVTSHDGALKSHLTDWSPIAKVKTIYLWPDHDAIDPKTGKRKGHEHMHQVAEILSQFDPAPKLMCIDPEILGLDEDGSDVVDYLAEYGGDTKETKADAIRCAIATAAPMNASRLSDFIEEAIAGKRQPAAWPWPMLTRLGRALLPGTVTCICGNAGASKSLMVLEAAWWWHRQNVKVAVFMLEEDKEHHLARAFAQIDENSNLTLTDWMQKNPEETKAAHARHKEFLDSFEKRIDAAPEAAPDHKVLLDWIRRRAEEGCRVLVIDPITAAAVSEKPWLDDLNFLTGAKKIMREYGASLVLVTHPKKGNKRGTGMDDLAGGAAYTRFSQSILWLVLHEKPKDARVSGTHGPFTAKINRSIRIVKTRNGPGAGVELAFCFEPKSLRFSEQGIVIGDADEPAQTEDVFASNPAQGEA